MERGWDPGRQWKKWLLLGGWKVPLGRLVGDIAWEQIPVYIGVLCFGGVYRGSLPPDVIFFFFLSFLGLRPWHVEVPR